MPGHDHRHQQPRPAHVYRGPGPDRAPGCAAARPTHCWSAESGIGSARRCAAPGRLRRAIAVLVGESLVTAARSRRPRLRELRGLGRRAVEGWIGSRWQVMAMDVDARDDPATPGSVPRSAGCASRRIRAAAAGGAATCSGLCLRPASARSRPRWPPLASASCARERRGRARCVGVFVNDCPGAWPRSRRSAAWISCQLCGDESADAWALATMARPGDPGAAPAPGRARRGAARRRTGRRRRRPIGRAGRAWAVGQPPADRAGRAARRAYGGTGVLADWALAARWRPARRSAGRRASPRPMSPPPSPPSAPGLCRCEQRRRNRRRERPGLDRGLYRECVKREREAECMI